MNRPYPFKQALEAIPGMRQTLGEGLDQRAQRGVTPLPSPSSKERRLLDRDFKDTIKSLQDAWKDGRQADAAQHKAVAKLDALDRLVLGISKSSTGKLKFTDTNAGNNER